MQNDSHQIAAALAYLQAQAGTRVPALALVLGSGLGAFAEGLTDSLRLAYADIPHCPVGQVAGHAGTLVLGHSAGVQVAALCGRAHLYEGHDALAATFLLRTLLAWGVRRVVLTNAAGGANPDFQPGDIMLIEDHLNLTGVTPLGGRQAPTAPSCFIDMTAAYTPRLAALARAAAQQLGLRLQQGVYAALPGPSYETPAEVRMLQRLGADAVGMSTVLETLAARHAGAEVLGLSIITNRAAGLSSLPLSHAEVTQVAHRVRGDLSALLALVIAQVDG